MQQHVFHTTANQALSTRSRHNTSWLTCIQPAPAPLSTPSRHTQPFQLHPTSQRVPCSNRTWGVGEPALSQLHLQWCSPLPTHLHTAITTPSLHTPDLQCSTPLSAPHSHTRRTSTFQMSHSSCLSCLLPPAVTRNPQPYHPTPGHPDPHSRCHMHPH